MSTENKEDLPTQPRDIEEAYRQKQQNTDNSKWVIGNWSEPTKKLQSFCSTRQKILDIAHAHPILSALTLTIVFAIPTIPMLLLIALPVSWMVVIGLLPLLAPIIIATIYFTTLSSQSVIENFFQGELLNKSDTSKKALDSMNDAMRQEAEKFSNLRQAALSNKTYEIPPTIKFKQKIKNLLAYLPADFPLQTDFSINNTTSIAQENNNVRFYSDVENVKLFAKFIEIIFNIGLRMRYEPFWKQYYLEITEEKLNSILEMEISKEKIENFYRDLQVTHQVKIMIENAFHTWESYGEHQTIVNNILVNLEITQDQGGFTAKYKRQDNHYDHVPGFNFSEVSKKHKKEMLIYDELEKYITQKFPGSTLKQEYFSRCGSHLETDLTITLTQQQVDNYHTIASQKHLTHSQKLQHN